MSIIGSLVGDYRVEARVAQGGFGGVYRARSVRTGDVVALKLVPSLNEDDVAAERLGAELQQQFERRHGMVPKVFELGETDHYFFIAMELVDAPTLATLIQRGALAPAAAATNAIAVCRFLERAHTFAADVAGQHHRGIVHGDLKPEHVFVLPDGTIKVLDFGVSKALASHKTRTRLVAVTPAYAPPNRLDTTFGNEKDDLWALGVMLYEMVAGHRPYSSREDRENPYAVQGAVERNEPREPLPATCPVALAAIIDKLLAYREQLRYPSAAAIRQDVEAFLRGESPQALRQYATAPTIKAPDPQQASRPARASSIPTLRPPAANRSPAPEPQVRVPVYTPWAVVRGTRTFVRRGMWLAALLFLTSAFTSESVAWLGAERIRAELPRLDIRNVAGKRQQYERLWRRSLFHVGPRLRLEQPLKARLVSAADAVIADFRQDEPTVAARQWQDANDALEWAEDLTPDDESVRPRVLICRGHIDRIAAQALAKTNPLEAQRRYNRAIEKFQRAARLDPESPDPYLGLSRIYIYDLHDVDRGATAIHEAEVRGHQPGWRDQAQVGDGYLRRADETTRKARGLSDDARGEALERARHDYERCVETFGPILEKGRSMRNRDYCQRRRDDLNRAAANTTSEQQP